MVPYEAFDARTDRSSSAVATIGCSPNWHGELGKPEWSEDDRFATNRARLNHKTTLVVLMSEILRSQPRASLD